MKAVVCGGAGFLGSHVADALTERNYEVTIVDLNPSAYATAKQEVVLGDIRDKAAMSRALQGADYVYHLAGVGDLDDAATKPLETVEQNVLGTVSLLDAARQAGVKRFVYASTVYVYSALGGFYRCSKQAAELYIEESQRRYGLDYTIVRYGTLYGPRADARNSLWRYLRQGLAEGRIAFEGTGEEVREYLHVRDAAQLSVDILADQFRNQPVIITGHQPMKTKDMLNMIHEILDHRLAIEYVPVNPARQAYHYVLTPYSFTPKVGKKLVSNCYVDMGQGLLECLQELAGSTPRLGPPPSLAGGASLGMSPQMHRGVVLPRTECDTRHEVSERSESKDDVSGAPGPSTSLRTRPDRSRGTGLPGGSTSVAGLR